MSAHSSLSTRSYTDSRYWLEVPPTRKTPLPTTPPPQDDFKGNGIKLALLILLLVVLAVAVSGYSILSKISQNQLPPKPRAACTCPMVTNSYVVPVYYGKFMPIYARRERVEKQHTADCEAGKGDQ